jgi:hypothetical protein
MANQRNDYSRADLNFHESTGAWKPSDMKLEHHSRFAVQNRNGWMQTIQGLLGSVTLAQVGLFASGLVLGFLARGSAKPTVVRRTKKSKAQ